MVVVQPAPASAVQLAERTLQHCAWQYELRFMPLFDAGRGYAFPCDADGNVDIDRLTDRARTNYFYARTTVGRNFRLPTTCKVVDRILEPLSQEAR
jgi:hypothetical protein